MGLKIPVYGSVVEWGDDGATYDRVPGVTTIVIPDISTTYDDVTDLDSEGGMMEYQRGLSDTSEEQLECWFSEDLMVAAKAKEALAGGAHFRVTMPASEGQVSGPVFSYRAHVTASVPSQDVKGKWKLTLKLRPTGGVDFVEGVAA